MAAIPPATSAVVEAIYRSYETARSAYRPRRIGVSKIGHPCDRHIWYAFRWCLVEHIPGQRLRLFDRGNREEPRFVADLRAIGCTVSDVNPDTGRQWHATACDDWLGASIDAAALGVPGAEKTWHDVSLKTHNDKSFASLVKKGVRESHPEHVVQMILEMELHGFERALYLAVNKNTDALHAERLHADPCEALRYIERASRIVYADKPPERIGGPDWFQCKFCSFRPICHEQQFPERNCRTCMHSTPLPGCKWECAVHGDCRDDCPDHQYIPELVPGKQVDVSDGRVVYEMHGGVEWVDGVKKKLVDDSDPLAALAEVTPKWSIDHTLHSCNDQECFVCNGGLALCDVCGGAESCLPTHCPGFKMSGEQLDKISSGHYNFIDGRWIRMKS